MQGKGSAKAILYTAKSSPGGRGSVPDQVAKCREFAEREGYAILATYSEQNASASSEDRGPRSWEDEP